MNLIEQAAKHLETLRRAGADLPDDGSMSLERPLQPKPMGRVISDPSAAAVEKASFPPSPSNCSSTSEESEAHRVELNLAQLAAAGFITPDMPNSRLADDFRVIKRPLITNAFGKVVAQPKNGNLIMVTSAIAGEGKSFCSINLAMSMAMEMDRTVMLVDADVARPSLPRLLGLPSTQGLLDLLLDESIDHSQVLLRTNLEKLTILPCGTQHARAAELLASAGMTRLLSEIASRYSDRIIIFDSPPLLLTTEARVLATHMGQIVFVVQAGTTLQTEVQEALDTIEACPLKLMVLNQTNATQGAYGYRYG